MYLLLNCLFINDFVIYHSDQNICKYSKYFIIHALKMCVHCVVIFVFYCCASLREHKVKEEKGKSILVSHTYIYAKLLLSVSRQSIIGEIYLGFKDFLVVK